MNKKNIIIIVSATFLVIALGIIVYISLHHHAKEEEKNTAPEIISTEELNDLVSRNYQLSYLFLSNIEVGAATINVTDVADPYHAIIDEKLNNLNTFNEVEELINNTLKATDGYNFNGLFLENSKYNHLAEVNSHLYVKLKSAACQLDDLNLEKIDYQKVDDNTIDIQYNNQTIMQGIKVDNKWYTTDFGFDCNK